MPTFPGSKGSDIRPDWVCDVVSPLSGRYGLAAARDIYARKGVSHLWNFDPVARTIEVFEFAGAEWLLVTTVSGDRLCSAIFMAFIWHTSIDSHYEIRQVLALLLFDR